MVVVGDLGGANVTGEEKAHDTHTDTLGRETNFNG